VLLLETASAENYNVNSMGSPQEIWANAGAFVGKVILGVTISLDGFAEDGSGSVGALYPDLKALDNSEVMRESERNTGAVVMAWKEYAMAPEDWDWGDYEYQVPIFVFTYKVPRKQPKEIGKLSFIFVTDGIESAVYQAKAAAGEKDVTIIGSASTTQSCLRARVADELQVDIIPVFLHNGFRPFEELNAAPIRLERTKVVELPGGRTHMRFSVTYD
jgi:dihydrofolate reductase